MRAEVKPPAIIVAHAQSNQASRSLLVAKSGGLTVIHNSHAVLRNYCTNVMLAV